MNDCYYTSFCCSFKKSFFTYFSRFKTLFVREFGQLKHMPIISLDTTLTFGAIFQKELLDLPI
jgi:hypothetical protein